LARGYCNSPSLSAERFVPDPFSSLPGCRLYRSGDAGRYLSDGNIDFLGRADDQVKLRGYRVEPGEIAAVLEEHQAIVRAAVTAWSEGGETRLAAYYVAATGGDMERDELRTYLEG